VAGESVLRFGEDGHPVTELAQVRELDSLQIIVGGRGESSYLVTTDFKLGKIPGSVFVGGALDVPERGLVCGNIAADVQGYLNCVCYQSRCETASAGSPPTLQELVSLVPVHLRLKVDVGSATLPQGCYTLVRNA